MEHLRAPEEYKFWTNFIHFNLKLLQRLMDLCVVASPSTSVLLPNIYRHFDFQLTSSGSTFFVSPFLLEGAGGGATVRLSHAATPWNIVIIRVLLRDKLAARLFHGRNFAAGTIRKIYHEVSVTNLKESVWLSENWISEWRRETLRIEKLYLQKTFCFPEESLKERSLSVHKGLRQLRDWRWFLEI